MCMRTMPMRSVSLSMRKRRSASSDVLSTLNSTGITCASRRAVRVGERVRWTRHQGGQPSFELSSPFRSAKEVKNDAGSVQRQLKERCGTD